MGCSECNQKRRKNQLITDKTYNNDKNRDIIIILNVLYKNKID